MDPKRNGKTQKTQRDCVGFTSYTLAVYKSYVNH